MSIDQLAKSPLFSTKEQDTPGSLSGDSVVLEYSDMETAAQVCNALHSSPHPDHIIDTQIKYQCQDQDTLTPTVRLQKFAELYSQR